MVSVDICGRSCNIIDDPYAQVCVPDKVKKINAKVFNSMFGGNETRFLVQHELCECKCGLSKVYVIQAKISKNGIMMYVSVSVQN